MIDVDVEGCVTLFLGSVLAIMLAISLSACQMYRECRAYGNAHDRCVTWVLNK